MLQPIVDFHKAKGILLCCLYCNKNQYLTLLPHPKIIPQNPDIAFSVLYFSMENDAKTCLDAHANVSRRIDKFVKEFLSKHQGLFQKVLHLFKKVLSSFSPIIFSHFFEKSAKHLNVILEDNRFLPGKKSGCIFLRIHFIYHNYLLITWQ